MRALVAAALVAAIPAFAEGPALTVSIGCEGGMPMLIQIEAKRAAVATVTLEELLRFCAEPAPQKQKWRADT